MAWIYFQELVESDLHSNLGSEPSLIVSKTDTHKAYFCLGCNRVTLTELPSGTMSQLCGEECSLELTSSSEDFPAKTSASLTLLQKVWRESGVVFSTKLSAWSKNSHPDSSFWRTCQPSELAAFLLSSMPLQKSGMTVDGRVYLPQMLEPPTKENDGSYWRTPNANDAARGPMSLNTALTGGHQITLVTQIKHPELWPTPTATPYGSNKGGASGRMGKERLSLETMARKNLWPTPRTTDGTGGAMSRERALRTDPGKIQLREMARHNLWPTPRASEYKDCGPVGSKSQVHMEKRDYLCAKVKEESKPTGMLSPMWVEWLMGYPTGHTELSALATAWFRSKSEKRSKNSRGSTNG